MKLRTKGNSIRLRILRGELDRLTAGETLHEALTFPATQGSLAFTLGVRAMDEAVDASFDGRTIAITISAEAMQHWSHPDEVGVYGEVATPAGPLVLTIEKDFACLDGSDEENAGTFAHPNPAGVC